MPDNQMAMLGCFLSYPKLDIFLKLENGDHYAELTHKAQFYP